MLYNSELVVLSTERDKQLKAETNEKVNPFNAAAVRKKKAEKETTVVEQSWAPNIPKSKFVLPSSAARLCQCLC
jgi:hypothetical protein